ncbi:hypothetical protein D3C72_931740 [compost metagenome]
MGQKILSRFVNFNSCPLIFLTCVLSFGFNRVLRSPLLRGVIILSSMSLTNSAIGDSSSKTTFLGLLSSRIPSKEGCRITPSLVNSVKLTSQTSSGLSHVTVACGGLGLKRDGLFTSGSSLKGVLEMISGLKSCIICFCSFSLKPVPTLPV